MKIRGKLVLFELIIAALLTISLSLAIRSFTIIISLDDIEIELHEIKRQSSELNYDLIFLLVSPNDLKTELENIEIKARKYRDSIIAFENSREMRRISNEGREMFAELTDNTLRIIPSSYLSKISEDIFQLLEDDKYDALNGRSLIGAEQYMEQNVNVVNKFYTDLISLINIQRAKNVTMSAYTKDLLVLINNFKPYIEEAQQHIFRNIFINLLFFLSLSIILVIQFARNLSSRVYQVRNAFQGVSSGDFSRQLNIISDDEFGTLSRNFNTFTKTLWTRLENMRLIMHEVGDSIRNEIDSEKVESTIVYLARKNSGADGAGFYKINPDGETLSLTYAVGSFRPLYKSEILDNTEISKYTNIGDLIREERLPLEGSLIGKVAVSGNAEFFKNIDELDVEFHYEQGHELYNSSAMLIPLIAVNEVLGVLALNKTNEFRRFSDLEFSNMQSFGELSALTLDNLYKYSEMLESYELNREIGIAEDIQKDLLPEKIPAIQNFKTGYFYNALKGINGDFFDIVQLSRNKYMFAICEVAGKGVPAALVMVMIRTVLRLVASPELNAGEIVDQLNKNITERIQIENYATMSVLILDVGTGSLSFTSASHHPLYIYRDDPGQYINFESSGIPIGIDHNSKYDNTEFSLLKNDIFMLYTDGIPEARSRTGKEYSVGSFLKLIQDNNSKAPEEISRLVNQDLHYFERDAKQLDDQTMIIFKYLGESQDEN